MAQNPMTRGQERKLSHLSRNLREEFGRKSTDQVGAPILNPETAAPQGVKTETQFKEGETRRLALEFGDEVSKTTKIVEARVAEVIVDKATGNTEYFLEYQNDKGKWTEYNDLALSDRAIEGALIVAKSEEEQDLAAGIKERGKRATEILQEAGIDIKPQDPEEVLREQAAQMAQPKKLRPVVITQKRGGWSQEEGQVADLVMAKNLLKKPKPARISMADGGHPAQELVKDDIPEIPDSHLQPLPLDSDRGAGEAFSEAEQIVLTQDQTARVADIQAQITKLKAKKDGLRIFKKSRGVRIDEQIERLMEDIRAIQEGENTAMSNEEERALINRLAEKIEARNEQVSDRLDQIFTGRNALKVAMAGFVFGATLAFLYINVKQIEGANAEIMATLVSPGGDVQPNEVQALTVDNLQKAINQEVGAESVEPDKPENIELTPTDGEGYYSIAKRAVQSYDSSISGKDLDEAASILTQAEVKRTGTPDPMVLKDSIVTIPSAAIAGALEQAKSSSPSTETQPQVQPETSQPETSQPETSQPETTTSQPLVAQVEVGSDNAAEDDSGLGLDTGASVDPKVGVWGGIEDSVEAFEDVKVDEIAAVQAETDQEPEILEAVEDVPKEERTIKLSTGEVFKEGDEVGYDDGNGSIQEAKIDEIYEDGRAALVDENGAEVGYDNGKGATLLSFGPELLKSKKAVEVARIAAERKAQQEAVQAQTDQEVEILEGVDDVPEELEVTVKGSGERAQSQEEMASFLNNLHEKPNLDATGLELERKAKDELQLLGVLSGDKVSQDAETARALRRYISALTGDDLSRDPELTAILKRTKFREHTEEDVKYALKELSTTQKDVDTAIAQGEAKKRNAVADGEDTTPNSEQ